jgi:hypothetical protein
MEPSQDPVQGKSVEAGRRVRVPRGAQPPIQVFINGSEQAAGTDYTLRDNEILFSKPLMKEQVSRGRWLAMALGLFGSYGRNDSVDIHFQREGKTQVLSDAEILP